MSRKKEQRVLYNRKRRALIKAWESVNGKLAKDQGLHHKIPYHAGGTDDLDNLEAVYRPEHAQAHLELYEEFGRKEDLWAYRMLGGRKGIDLSGENNPMWGRRGENSPHWGKTPWNKGKKQSQAHTDNMAAGLAKEYIITFPDGREEKIKNLAKWCRENNLYASCLLVVAQGKRKQHKGYKARYA